MRNFHCGACGRQVYFGNTQCINCGAWLGFVPAELQVRAFGQALADGTWPLLGAAGPATWRPCTHRTDVIPCDWMVPGGDPLPECEACRLTDPRSNLAPVHAPRRAALEAEKRRLVYTLRRLRLPLRPKQGPGDIMGLAFRWFAPEDDGPTLTGHADGEVTINLEEADHVHRESARVHFNEPQRTLLGHLRHEVSHHLFQRFVSGTTFEGEFRDLFGDDRADYGDALDLHYTNGPPAGWELTHVSAYATSHPWEDWAETCAHYLLMFDAIETSAAWGVQLSAGAPGAPPVAPAPPEVHTPVQQLVVDEWLPVARYLNAVSRSIGVQDSYPFLLPPPVVRKLEFVQRVLCANAGS